MAAVVKIVPQSDWEVLNRYLNEEGVVLIPEEVVGKLPADKRKFVEELNGSVVEYDFGGEADVWVDTATDEKSFAMQTILEEDY